MCSCVFVHACEFGVCGGRMRGRARRRGRGHAPRWWAQSQHRANTAMFCPPHTTHCPRGVTPSHAALPLHTHLVGVGELLLGRRTGRPGGVPDVVGADEVLEPAGGRRVGLGGLRYLSPLRACRPLALYPQRGGLGGRRGGGLAAPSALGLLGGSCGGGGAEGWLRVRRRWKG